MQSLSHISKCTYRRLVRNPVRIHDSHLKHSELLEEYVARTSPHVSDIDHSIVVDSKLADDHNDDVSKTLSKQLKYTMFDSAPPAIKKYLGYAKSKKLREHYSIFSLEGTRLIADALKCHFSPHALLFSRFETLLNLVPSLDKNEALQKLNSFKLIKTPYKTLQTWSSLTTAPGIIGLFDLEDAKQKVNHAPDVSMPVTVIVDEIRDPANLGSMLRTLSSVGVRHIILIKGCVDLWDPKVLRASCGSQFFSKITEGITWDAVSSLVGDDSNVYLADTFKNEPSTPDEDGTYEEQAIPSIDATECISFDETGKKVKIDENYNNRNHLLKYKRSRFPVINYSSCVYFSNTTDEVVLVIGGEIGLTLASRKFVYDRNGFQVSIPVYNGVDSLNASVAAGIILYEVHKQYSQFSS